VSLTFLHPEAGWLLLLTPILFWLGRKASPVRLWLRLAVFAALIAALTQPSLIHPGRGAPQVFVIDQGDRLSPATRDQVGEAVIAAVARRRAYGPVTVIQRGGTPLKVRADRFIMLGADGADRSLTEALGLALNRFAAGAPGRVTLVSDGLSADRDWGRTVQGLVARGVAVDTVTLATGRQDAFIARVDAPVVGAGERMSLQVRLEGVGQGLSLAAFSGERRIAAVGPFDLDGGFVVPLSASGEAAGYRPVRLELSRDGAVVSRYQTIIPVQDPLPLLYANSREAGAGAALQRLLGDGVRVDARDAASLGTIDLGDYRAVMLDDVPASRLPAPTQRRLIEAVRSGGLGLLAAGGDTAFAPGGYAGTPLAAALPVEIKQDELTEDPSVALAVVIDTSGSMLGAPLDLAKQVARLAVRKLTPADSVGVVEFYGGRQWVTPMQPARDIPEVERAIGRVQAQGDSEHLFGALQEAYYGLQDTQARYRHILVISDAGVNADRYSQLIRHVAANQVTVSTVLIGGAGADREARMAQWARLGRGRFYVVNDEFNLVEINLKQPQQKPEPGVKRGGFALASSAPAYGWSDLASPPPALDGYALAGVRPLADTLLRTQTGDPVLASWQWGAGRVTALMTEPLGEGTEHWRDWAGYGDWLRRLLAKTADARPDWDVRLGRTGGRVLVVAQRLRGGGEVAPTLRLLGEGGGMADRDLRVVQRAPGLFTASVDVATDRAVRLDVRDRRGTTRAALPPLGGGDLNRPLSRADALPLDQLSRLTGGEVLGTVAALSSQPAFRGREAVALDLWGWLCWLALALYLADILYRRWPPRRTVAEA
jgi:Ca-activated chloride channel homolog